VDSIPDSAAVHALDGMDAAERRERVGSAVASLSATLREVVLLRVNAELEFREIAELLSDSVLREKLKASTDAAELHGMIAGWQSTQAA
jgi:DNA-directed RNA polymerase specialized sigma24 family protein